MCKGKMETAQAGCGLAARVLHNTPQRLGNRRQEAVEDLRQGGSLQGSKMQPDQRRKTEARRPDASTDWAWAESEQWGERRERYIYFFEMGKRDSEFPLLAVGRIIM